MLPYTNATPTIYKKTDGSNIDVSPTYTDIAVYYEYNEENYWEDYSGSGAYVEHSMMTNSTYNIEAWDKVVIGSINYYVYYMREQRFSKHKDYILKQVYD